VQEQDGSRLPSLSTIRQNVQGPIIGRGRVIGVGLVGVREEHRTIITALPELGIQRFSLSRFLCYLFAL